MSWDAYVSNNLMCPIDDQGTTLTSAALLGLDGSVWAKSEAFPDVSPAEISALAKLFETPAGSITLGGAKFIVTGSDDTVARGRGMGEQAKIGFICEKSATALVIGCYTDPLVAAGTCQTVVHALQDYLVNSGY